MNKKIFSFLVIGISFLSFYFNVFAYTEETVNYEDYYSLFGNFYLSFPFNEKTYSQFKGYFDNFINENLDKNEIYIVVGNSITKRFILSPVNLTYDYMFTTNSASFYEPGKVAKWYYFSYEFTENNENLNINYGGLSSFGSNNVMSYFKSNFAKYSTDSFLWANKPLKHKGEIDDSKTYYKHVFTSIGEELTKCGYENVGVYGINYPIYSFTNLIFCDYEEVKEKVNYKIEYYFDDILSPEKTEFKSGFENDLVTEFIDYSTDLYKLYTEDKEYKLTLSKDESLNVLKIFYRSPLYGTLKQPIDTSNSKIYLFFQFSDIKEMFPNIRFENFTQFEQLVVVGLFNLLYGVFFLICIYIILKSSFKCWSWIMEFVR